MIHSLSSHKPFKEVPLFLSLSGTLHLFKKCFSLEGKKQTPNPAFDSELHIFKTQLCSASWVLYKTCLVVFVYGVRIAVYCCFLQSFLSISILQPVFLVLFTLFLILSQQSLPNGAQTKDSLFRNQTFKLTDSQSFLTLV